MSCWLPWEGHLVPCHGGLDGSSETAIRISCILCVPVSLASPYWNSGWTAAPRPEVQCPWASSDQPRSTAYLLAPPFSFCP